MRLRLLMVLFLGLVGSAFARPPSSDRLFKHGVDAFYATNWTRADSSFNALMRSHPDDPRAYFFSSMIPFWAYFFGGNESAQAKSFLSRSERAIAVAEKRLAVVPGDTSTVLLLSGLHGYRSLVAANEKEYRVAIGSGVKGYSFTKRLMEYGQDNPNALMGQGVFHYMVGTVPGEIRWMASLAGLSGDKATGLRYLARVASSDSDARYDAIMILAFLMEREGRTDDALRYLGWMRRSYPDNVLALYHQSRLLEAQGFGHDARAGYLKVMQTRQPEFSFLRSESRKKAAQLAGYSLPQRSGTPID
jgi:hypothetical protein